MPPVTMSNSPAPMISSHRIGDPGPCGAVPPNPVFTPDQPLTRGVLEQQAGDDLTVRRRHAQHHLSGLGPPVVQVRVMVPGETDAPVNLDVRRGDVEVSLRAV